MPRLLYLRIELPEEGLADVSSWEILEEIKSAIDNTDMKLTLITPKINDASTQTQKAQEDRENLKQN